MTLAATWLAAARPATLPVSVAPVLVGAAATAGPLDRGALLAALIGAVSLQIAANFANDVYDAEKGADTATRLGPSRAVQTGAVSAGAMKQAMLLVLAIAVAAGAFLATRGGWPIVALGVAAMLAAVGYTGGPWPLGYHGLGDVCVFLFFGVAGVCGTAYVTSGRLTATACWAALPVGALATVVLVVNNIRDRHSDAPAGKRTLAVRFGRHVAVGEALGLLLLAGLATVAIALSRPAAALALLTAPLGFRLWRRIAASDGRALNPLLGAAARLLLLHAALLAVGLVWSR